MDELTTREQIKLAIVEEMYLEGVRLETIDDEAPLFGEGLGLDSLDAIELVLLVKAHFGVTISTVEEGREAFRSVSTLAEFIDARRPRG